MNALLLVTAGLYGLASVLYLAHLFGKGEGVARLARWTLTASVLVHLGLIGWYCSQKLNPVADLRGALSLIAWLLGTGFLVTSARSSRMGALGAFVAPLALVLLVVSGLTPANEPAVDQIGIMRVLGELHIGLSALGVSAFGLASAVALIYCIQENALKNKRLGPLFRRMPPLNTLDDAGRRLILVGYPLYTLALVTGVIWAINLPQVGVARPEFFIAGATWLVFGALIVLRVTLGWRGRRAALLTVAGFAAMVLVLMMYLVRRVLAG